ncbi:MAG: type II toxin-antitoxin system VapC family toxin [Candidatus Riflebacteria bacterium]|nr:type II toxin-antitoxin system VapC family toxin [Candidatus Riflebacteria bacterium]
MKKLRVYVDTSVIGGCFDPEFETWSNGLFQNFEKGQLFPLTSDVVAREIARAPLEVQEQFQVFLRFNPEIIQVNAEVIELRDAYLKKAILKARYANDLLHIAIATYANADVLVSWNFRHIVRFDKILLYNAANMENGYRSIQIYSPREVARIEND